MLEAAGGGGGGTDWWGMSMETIQQLAQSPDIALQDQIVDGWQKSAELLGDHMGQVQNYRDALATAWPPKTNSAADAYLTRLDALIKNLDETYEAALANHDALSSANLSLSLAKTQVSQIYGQWDANNKTLAAFNQTQQTAGSTGQPTPSPSPSGEEPPPVTAAQQEALRQKAVSVMSQVSSDLAEAQLQVVRPTLYDPQQFVQKGASSTGTGPANVPVVPPIVPTSFTGGGGSSSGGTRASTQVAAPFPTSSSGVPTTGPSLPGSNGGHPNLVLGGANPPSTVPPPSTGPNPISTLPNTGGSGPINNPGVLPPPGGGPFAPNGTPPPRAGGGLPNESGGFKPFGGGTLPEGGLKAMPPGGIIGKVPGGGLDEPAASRFGAQRVNPVGGVIGEPSPGGARGVGGFNGEGMMGGPGGMPGGARGGGSGQAGRVGVRGAASEQPYGQIGGRRSSRGQAEELRWDPDNPWVTETGVEPVVLPPNEQRIDPGPAIGLS